MTWSNTVSKGDDVPSLNFFTFKEEGKTSVTTMVVLDKKTYCKGDTITRNLKWSNTVNGNKGGYVVDKK